MPIKSELIDKLAKDLKKRGFRAMKYYNKTNSATWCWHSLQSSNDNIPFILVKDLICKLYVYEKDMKLMMRGGESPNRSYPRGSIHLEVDIADPQSFYKLYEMLNHFKHATDYLKEHISTIEGELG